MNHLVEILTLKLIFHKKSISKILAYWYFKLCIKINVDKLDIDKLAPASVDLNKWNDVVKNDVVKKSVYDKLVAKVNSTDTIEFVLKIN